MTNYPHVRDFSYDELVKLGKAYLSTQPYAKCVDPAKVDEFEYVKLALSIFDGRLFESWVKMRPSQQMKLSYSIRKIYQLRRCRG